jgi:ketosteroid isomerase-like protein
MEPSTELIDIVLRYYEAVSRGDTTLLEQLLSHEDGIVVIGTDPNEWWEGYENIMSTYKSQLKEMGGMAHIAGNPKAYCEGSVGWVMDHPKFKLPDGKEIRSRLTAVFHREDGQWRIIHYHASIGVSNEEAIGKALMV